MAQDLSTRNNQRKNPEERSFNLNINERSIWLILAIILLVKGVPFILELNGNGMRIQAQTPPVKGESGIPVLSPEEDTSVQPQVHALSREQVPAAVLQEFRKLEKDVADADVVWKQWPYGYEAIFSEGGQTFEIEFNHRGEWLETEREHIPAREVPQRIRNDVRNRFPGSVQYEYEMEITLQGVFFEIDASCNGIKKEFYYTDEGARAKNYNEDSEDDDDLPQQDIE